MLVVALTRGNALQSVGPVHSDILVLWKNNSFSTSVFRNRENGRAYRFEGNFVDGERPVECQGVVDALELVAPAVEDGDRLEEALLAVRGEDVELGVAESSYDVSGQDARQECPGRAKRRLIFTQPRRGRSARAQKTSSRGSEDGGQKWD